MRIGRTDRSIAAPLWLIRVSPAPTERGDIEIERRWLVRDAKGRAEGRAFFCFPVPKVVALRSRLCSLTMDPLEKSILDGTAFRGPRTPSPTRSASTGSPAPSASPSSSRSASPVSMPAGAPQRTSGPQTGPKGVKADRDHARELERDGRREARRARDAELSKRAMLAGDWREQERLQKKEDRRRRDQGRAGSREEQERGGSDLDDDDLDEDAEAISAFRRARILELQGGQGTSASSSQRAGTSTYGQLLEVDGDEYASQIDDVPIGTSVVVHIYSHVSLRACRGWQPTSHTFSPVQLSPTCHTLCSSLSSLAQLHPTTKFVQVPAWQIGFGLSSSSAARLSDDEEEEESEATLHRRAEAIEQEAAAVTPTILIYRDGQLVANLVRVDLMPREEGGVGNGAGEEDVLRCLRLHGAI